MFQCCYQHPDFCDCGWISIIPGAAADYPGHQRSRSSEYDLRVHEIACIRKTSVSLSAFFFASPDSLADQILAVRFPDWTRMDRRRAGSPVYGRQRSGGSSSTGSSSPAMSPAHHRSASAAGSFSSIKRTQNVAAKAAAQRLAQVMASQTAEADDDDDEDGDLSGGFRYNIPPRYANNSLPAISAGRPTRSPSPALGRNFAEPATSVRSSSAGRPSVSVRSAAPLVPPSKTSLRAPTAIPPIEPPDRRKENKRFPADVGHLNSREPGNQREASALQDELDMLQEENESLHDKLRLAAEKYEEAGARARELEKQVAALGEGVSLEARLLNRKEAALRQREAALKAAKQSQDGRDEEIAALKLEIESAKDEAAAAVEQQREAESEAKAFRTMTQRMVLTQEEMEEVLFDLVSFTAQLKRNKVRLNIRGNIRGLQKDWKVWNITINFQAYDVMCHPELLKVLELTSIDNSQVLFINCSSVRSENHAVGHKRCESKDIGWGFELKMKQFRSGTIMLEGGLEHAWIYGGNDDPEKRNKLVRDLSDLTGEGNVESMLSVEKGLRELASLKVEEAVVLAMAHHRRPNSVRQSTSDIHNQWWCKLRYQNQIRLDGLTGPTGNHDPVWSDPVQFVVQEWDKLTCSVYNLREGIIVG
ncbi:hypothetical protein ACLOJK_019282 [Asimina triloba]